MTAAHVLAEDSVKKYSGTSKKRVVQSIRNHVRRFFGSIGQCLSAA